MLALRVIPCLDVKDGRVVKGVNFVSLRDAGDPVEQARLYGREGADELTFLDIAASHENHDTILDVVEERLVVDGAGERAGYLGSIVVAGKVTELLDTAWWLRQAGEDWFGSASSKAVGDARRVLLVEDSAFFRNLVVPALGAAGYVVTAVADAAEAKNLVLTHIPPWTDACMVRAEAAAEFSGPIELARPGNTWQL